MTIVVACPTCQQKIRAPESVLGRQIKCPQCKNAFIPEAAPTQAQVTASAPPEPPPYEPPASTWESAGQNDLPEPEPTYTPTRRSRDTGGRSGEKSGGGFVDYLLFRRMVTPGIITVIFYIGVVGIILGGLISTGITVFALIRSELYGMAILYLVIGFMSGLMGLVFWRIYCELIILAFRIYETLTEIRDKL